MHGIKIKIGVNDCKWNVRGYCVNPAVTKNPIMTNVLQDWVSTYKCPYTILDMYKCSEYALEGGKSV